METDEECVIIFGATSEFISYGNGIPELRLSKLVG